MDCKDTFFHILTFIDLKDLANVPTICKSWNNMMSTMIYKYFFQQSTKKLIIGPDSIHSHNIICDDYKNCNNIYHFKEDTLLYKFKQVKDYKQALIRKSLNKFINNDHHYHVYYRKTSAETELKNVLYKLNEILQTRNNYKKELSKMHSYCNHFDSFTHTQQINFNNKFETLKNINYNKKNEKDLIKKIKNKILLL